jgi:mannose-1-phosphate guanylyltransferase/phosphomannomutase
MKGFILGAGRGTRLQPLSNELPAPMLPILNKPLLLYIIEHFQKFDIKNIKINLHHLPEYIDSYFETGENFGVEISYSLEKNLLGTASALKRVESFFDDSTLVHSGNCLADVDLNEIYYFHKQKKSLLTFVVTEDRTKELTAEYELNNNGQIIKSNYRVSKANAQLNFIPIGIYIIEKEILKLIPSQTQSNIDTDVVNTLLLNKIDFYAYFTQKDNYRITNPHDLLDLNMKLLDELTLDQNKLIHKHDSAYIHNSVISTIKKPIMIGEDSRISKNVEFLGSSVIGSNVKIDEGAIISNSLILNNTYIGKNIEINNSIVYKNLHLSIARDYSIYINDEFILSELKKNPRFQSAKKIILRSFDIILSLTALVLFAPVFIFISILIKLDSRGPVLYYSRRIKMPQIVQHKEKWFRFQPACYVDYIKFRTMVIEQDKFKNSLNSRNLYLQGPFFKVKDDPRITRIGKLLRRTSLDEFPLLINVLKGDLSLVGIWGLPPQEAESLQSDEWTKNNLEISETAKFRFRGNLGLAGYWQSRGRSELTTEERIVHDSIQSLSDIDDQVLSKNLGEYKKSHSVKGYISLILDTVKSVLKKKGSF